MLLTGVLWIGMTVIHIHRSDLHVHNSLEDFQIHFTNSIREPLTIPLQENNSKLASQILEKIGPTENIKQISITTNQNKLFTEWKPPQEEPIHGTSHPDVSDWQIQHFDEVTQISAPITLEDGLVLGRITSTFSSHEEFNIHNKNLLEISLLGALAVALAALIAFIWSRKLFDELDELKATTTAICQGDVAARVNLPEGSLLSGIGSSLNQIAMTLQVTTTSMRNLDLTFASISDALFVVDENCIITSINKATCRLLGKEGSDILMCHAKEVFAPEVDAASLCRALLVTNLLTETYLLHKDGSKIPVRLSSSIVGDKLGEENHGAVCACQDIGKQREAQASLVKAKEAAEEANNMKTDFLTTMTHELRTPMNAIIGFTDWVLEGHDGPLTDEQSESLGRVSTAGSHLLQIINDILDISKIEKGDMYAESSLFTLSALLEEVNTMIAPKIENKKLQYKCEIDNRVPNKICNDRQKLAQILLNLLDNANKFSQKGTISLSVAPGIEPGAHGEETLLFAIHDEGPGIPLEQQCNLFEHFTQQDSSTTRAFGGAGLGLSICKSLTQCLGGKIWVKSTPGEGSTFLFTISSNLSSDKDADEN